MSGTFVVRLGPESSPVNGLFVGWVEVVDNPAHKRSPLVRLTQSGTAFPAKIRDAETDVMERLAGAFLIEDVKASTTLLAGIRKRLQKPRPAAAPETGDREPAETPEPVDEEIPVSLL